MSDESQWRDKYRESLSRLSAEEARRSRLQSVLRILISRLCVAGQGRDARLDAELRKVAEAVRKGVDTQKLEDLLDPLSQAVTAPGCANAGGQNGRSPNLPQCPRAPIPTPLHRFSTAWRSCRNCAP